MDATARRDVTAVQHHVSMKLDGRSRSSPAPRAGWAAASRGGSPDEMGALCAFLASDDASFITGAAINLTGGEQYFF